jgi:hypothetical protein
VTWAKSDDEKWAFVGFDEDTGFPSIASFDVESFVIKTLLLKSLIKPSLIPEHIRDRVSQWPRVSLNFGV